MTEVHPKAGVSPRASHLLGMRAGSGEEEVSEVIDCLSEGLDTSRGKGIDSGYCRLNRSFLRKEKDVLIEYNKEDDNYSLFVADKFHSCL